MATATITAVNVQQVGRELNVRYVLEGSVQRSGKRIRVNVQLIDAESGKHLWAERFEKPVVDLFDMQDEIVARLAQTLDAQLVVAEARRAERSRNPDALELVFQGFACVYRGPTPEHLTQAFERALAIDPRNVGALVGMATVDATMGGLHVDGRPVPTPVDRRNKRNPSAIVGPGPGTSPQGPGYHLQYDKPLRPGDCGMRACLGA